MSTIASPPVMTTEELLALPDSGTERMLIGGQLIEWPLSMRNRPHCEITANTSYFLKDWALQQAMPRGEIRAGDIGFRFRRNPEY